MSPDDYTFAFLAKAIAAAGGSVHVTALDILRFNSTYMVEMQDDGKGGHILTLAPRPGKQTS